ncbi:hypothetical protein BB561_004769 [Smittium simulii]|uniref:tRNA pseudouridine(55) synthase n=1 Tax=Smittium simulii TaxID=133385 RepID=A0A2T9YEA4_9FUNG|nr:hypothetical protein BB561_004769 [Smittium simulii]
MTAKVSGMQDKWKVGHGGTLDPFADGVLIVGLGSGCKSLPNYLSSQKQYTGKATLGVSTDTQDIEGMIDQVLPYGFVTEQTILDALPKFTGQIYQTPPMYSALKLNGKPLYEYARKGLEVPTFDKTRMVSIYRLEINDFYNPELIDTEINSNNRLVKINDKARDIPISQHGSFGFTVECSKGTYIRTLFKDICAFIGTAGFLTSLTRTKQGPYELGKDTITLEDLKNKDLVISKIQKCTLAHNQYFNDTIKL